MKIFPKFRGVIEILKQKKLISNSAVKMQTLLGEAKRHSCQSQDTTLLQNKRLVSIQHSFHICYLSHKLDFSHSNKIVRSENIIIYF